MPSLNKVLLLGNCGKDPVIRHSPSGVAVCSFSLATTKRMKDKDPVTNWHNIVCFGKYAENHCAEMRKGDAVFIEGELQTRSYEKDGVKKWITEIVANTVYPLRVMENQTSEEGGDIPF